MKAYQILAPRLSYHFFKSKMTEQSIHITLGFLKNLYWVKAYQILAPRLSYHFFESKMTEQNINITI